MRDGVGLAGRGVAARVPVSAAPDALAAIEHDDRSGTGVAPVAVGWVPFDPAADGEVVVPAVTVRKLADGRRLVTVDRRRRRGARRAAGAEPTASAYTIEPVTPVEQYLAAVAAVRDAVRAGALTKAVIARQIAVTADRPIDRHGVLHRLKASFGSSYRYAVDGLIGASPELLVEVDGHDVRAHPLAGTAPRTGDVDRDAEIAAELVASTKNQIEHRVVIDVVHDTLLPWCSFLDWEPDPSIVTVANVQHLGTRIEGDAVVAAAERARARARPLADARRRRAPAAGRARPDRRRRGRRPRSLRRRGRMGRRRRQRHVGRHAALRRAVGRPHDGPA